MSGGSAGSGHGDGENCVRAEIRFIGSAIGVDHAAINGALIGSVHAGDGLGDFGVHVTDGFQNAFAEVAGFITVAEFIGFVLACGCARGNGSAANSAAFDAHFGFNSRIAAGIDNFSPSDGDNFGGHCSP